MIEAMGAYPEAEDNSVLSQSTHFQTVYILEYLEFYNIFILTCMIRMKSIKKKKSLKILPK